MTKHCYGCNRIVGQSSRCFGCGHYVCVNCVFDGDHFMAGAHDFPLRPAMLKRRAKRYRQQRKAAK